MTPEASLVHPFPHVLLDFLDCVLQPLSHRVTCGHKSDVKIELDPMYLSSNNSPPCLLETRRWSCLSWSGRSRRQWWLRQTCSLSASGWAGPEPLWRYPRLCCWTRNGRPWRNKGTEMIFNYILQAYHVKCGIILGSVFLNQKRNENPKINKTWII